MSAGRADEDKDPAPTASDPVEMETLPDSPGAVVAAFWRLMNGNDFRAVGTVLSDAFVLEWPQTRERIRGRDHFAAVNEEYPAQGRWRFTVNTIVGDGRQAVSDVSVTDGTQVDRAVSFFTVADGKITRIVEFWPDAAPAQENRAHLVEPMGPD